ncbi:MAG: 1-deoxy-D-xylulose-5-phosphate reductoisomerase [Rhodospirillaceae bacterium]|nr:1-deoxy-D-xylulose-5-phosphate reductoisomerase [Rhodospirillaceae bacterium]MBT4589278.1 1-deoxy-D-xylulose-5-phosphate reductoisomerase [Rhodospirillaceae bacterium]MBT4938703.1 1-deoxy-D-xylulose-5-phosphate reductoisomerase [Rhodospirillaceae bacterium]
MKVAPEIGIESTDKRSITILGATGSVGCNTLELVNHEPDNFEVVALTGNKNVQLLIEQARQFSPELAVIADEALYGELKEGLSDTQVTAAAGEAALNEAADMKSDIVMAGIVGVAGLAPTLTAARRGAIVALANKETLVCAGDLFLAEIDRSGATLLPVDSEHNAIFQVFDFDHADSVDHLTLTASGGPFRTTSAAEMTEVTPAQAVAHPNWDMGAKISIDSATMMNKGLELIEAYYLFPVEERQIEILVHPQSVIHSMVNYKDGSVLAQLGPPDMRTPIAYALAWPNRMTTPGQKLDLAEIGQLTFEAPDFERFPALTLARDALITGGSLPTLLNAANEVAVRCFLEERIGFLDITRVTEDVLEKAPNQDPKSLEDISQCDLLARALAEEAVTALT